MIARHFREAFAGAIDGSWPIINLTAYRTFQDCSVDESGARMRVTGRTSRLVDTRPGRFSVYIGMVDKMPMGAFMNKDLTMKTLAVTRPKENSNPKCSAARSNRLRVSSRADAVPGSN